MTFLADLTRSLVEEFAEELDIVRVHMLDATQRDAPVLSGELRDSIGMEPFEQVGEHFRATIFAEAPQARWTNDGTGIYGPTGSRIYPTSGRVLGPFYWNRIGETVAFASVAGQPAQHWWDDDSGEKMERRLQDALDAAWGF